MNTDRFENTQRFRELGTFWCSEVLEKHEVIHPTDQAVAICRFIVEDIPSAEFRDKVPAPEEVQDWAKSCFSRIAGDQEKLRFDLSAWRKLAAISVSIVAWDPLQHLANLIVVKRGELAFKNAEARLRSRGFTVDDARFLDLTERFSGSAIRRSIRGFDPSLGSGHEEQWLRQVFYRWALKDLITARNQEEQYRIWEDLRNVPVPDADMERGCLTEVADRLAGAFERLSDPQKLAISLYFGLTGKEYRLKDIGKSLDLSEYKTRTLIVQGLGALASHLGVSGSLNESEFKCIDLLHNEGRDVQAVARQMKCSESDVRNMLKGIDNKFRRALRPRTQKPVMKRKLESDEMSGTEFVSGAFAMTPSDLYRELDESIAATEESVEVIREKNGALKVHLGGQTFSGSFLRRVMTEHPGYIDALSAKGLSVADIMLDVNDPTSNDVVVRADLWPEDRTIAELLDASTRKHWITSERIYEECREAKQSVESTLLTEDKSLAIERIFRVLSGVSQSIELERLDSEDDEDQPYLWIEKTSDGNILATWKGNGEYDNFDLAQLIANEADLVGEVDKMGQTFVVNALTRGLLDGDYDLPEFEQTGDATSSHTALRWVPTTLGD